MLKALAIKELRESLGIVALAVLGLGYVLLGLIGVAVLPWQYAQQPYFPFSAGAYHSGLMFCLAALAVLLGFRQTAWELHNNTFAFLLHKPLPRGIVFAVKLVLGAVLLLVINALFIGVYGWWAATPGNQSTPFFWSMTLPAWKLGFCVLPIYLGAFLSGMRPGNWFGSRLLPAASGVAIYLWANSIVWWWLTAFVLISTCGVLLLGIFYHVHSRDY